MAVRAGVQLGVSVARSLSAKELDLSEGDMALVTEVHLRITRGELDVPPPKKIRARPRRLLLTQRKLELQEPLLNGNRSPFYRSPF